MVRLKGILPDFTRSRSIAFTFQYGKIKRVVEILQKPYQLHLHSNMVRLKESKKIKR